MNETFMLYLFTRLNSLSNLLDMLCFITGISSIVVVVAALIYASDGDTYPTAFHKLWWACAVITILNIITPTQKDVALILAGSTIVSIAKTDDAKRITSKSVQVVEQYLDVLLKEKK